MGYECEIMSPSIENARSFDQFDIESKGILRRTFDSNYFKERLRYCEQGIEAIINVQATCLMGHPVTYNGLPVRKKRT